MLPDIELHEDVINPCYLQYLEDFRYFQIFKGGGSAGKSVFIAQKIIFHMMDRIGYNGMILRKHNADNHTSTFQELCKVINQWNIEHLFRVNKSFGGESITCVNGNQVIFKGLDDVEKRKGVTFATGPLVFVWMEEATEMSEDDLNQMIIRLRGESSIPKHIYVSFNPIDIDHWLKARFFDRPMDVSEGFICETTYIDNQFLTDIDRRNIEAFKEIDHYYYMVYALNQWGSINTARVFTNIVIEDFEYTAQDMRNVCHGMDFGFIHASTLMSLGFRERDLYIYGEHYYKELTNDEFIERVKESPFNRNNLVTADSSEPARIKSWNQHGYNVQPAKKGPDSLRRGIDYLKSYKIHIHKTNCPNSAREFPRFKYREMKDGRIVDEVIEIDDDTIAGCRYAVEHLITGFAPTAYDADGHPIS
jgi:phage terminase large subunit